jgi:hypothetical protein
MTFPLKSEMQGPTVADLQEALRLLLDRGAIRTLDSPNRPTAEELATLGQRLAEERAQSVYGKATQRLVLYVQLQEGLGDGLGGAVDEKTAARLNEILKRLGAFETVEGYVVRGTVQDASGNAMPGVVVRASDRDLRRREPLGEARTNEGGNYEIRYAPKRAARAEAGGADLQIQVFDSDLLDRLLGESTVRFNAGSEATIDLTLAASAKRTSEFETCLAKVMPLLQGQGAGDDMLSPSELTDADIAFIVDETGLNIDQLRLWALAAKESKEQPATMSSHWPASSLRIGVMGGSLPATAASPPLMVLLYGWFRDGQPQGLKELLDRSNDDLVASIGRAVEQNYIPALDQRFLEALPPALKLLRASVHLKPSGDAEVASLGDTLRLLPDADRLRLDQPDGPGATLVTLLANAAPENPPSWEERLQAVGNENLLRSVQRSLGLRSLTGGFVPWMRGLQQSATSAADPTLADLVAKDTADWITFARQHGVPKSVDGTTDEERFTSYGREIARRIQLLHPTLYVQQRIASDRIPVATGLKDPIRIFCAANPAFRLKETPLLAYRLTNDFSSGHLSDESLAAVSTELMKIERAAALVPLLDYVGPLLDANYDSARSIVNRRSRQAFVAEMRNVLGDEEHVGQVYDAAAGIAANTDALVLRHSPLFRGPDLPVMPSEDRPTNAASRAARTGASGALPLPPNLQQLFGNQDYCECAHGASLYGAAAYLADLLQMLDRTPRSNGKTALQVLLERRADLAELDLTADNTDIRLQYIDLVLEVLERPDWDAGNGFRVLRGGTPQNPNNDFDTQLDQGVVPGVLADDLGDQQRNLSAGGLASWGLALSEHRTSDRAADVQNSAGVTLPSWVIRDQKYGLKLRLIGAVYGAYRVRAYPQSVAGMPKGYRPWSTLLSAVARSTSSARFPWSLPFDVNRDEANAWLKWLGASREDLLLALTTIDRWSNVDAACEHLSLNPSTRTVLTTAPSAAHPDYQDWGFPSGSVGVEGIVDPIAGLSGTLNGGMINWTGPEPRPEDQPVWYALLKNVSLLRARSRLTHRELLNVLAMRFVLAGATRYDVTGPECDSALMRLESMDAALARRIHLFVRLWRLVGWSMVDVDASINARPAFVSGANNAISLSADYLLFIANIARLSARGRVPVAICMDLFSVRTLDTTSYWNYDGAQPTRTLSRYEIWFDNSALGRPRLPEFRLNRARTALTTITPPATGLPKARISDHLTYVAAALGMPESDLAALLPVGIVLLPSQAVTAAVTSDAIRIGGSTTVDVEVLIGALSSGASFLLTVQESDDGSTFQDVAAANLNVTPTTALLSRLSYSGGKSYLRVRIEPTAGANPSVWMTVRVLRTPGQVRDELTLENLTTLCKYGVLHRLIGKKPMPDVLTLLQLSALDPFVATAGPDVALALLDAREALGALGMSIAEAERLLRGPDETTSVTLEKQAGVLLAAARSGNVTILNESTVTPHQRSVLLSKILTDFGWDSVRIADVLSAMHLGLNWDDYVAPLAVLPAGVNLPASITYDQKVQQLTASLKVRPTALRADIAPLLATTTGDLNVALVSLWEQAQSREAELALLQTLLREKTPHTFETAWSIPASGPLVIPTEWKDRLYYERAVGKLRFVGWMSPADQAALIALGPSLNVSASTPTFTAAINDLFNQAKLYTPDAANTLVVRQGAPGLAAETLLLDTVGLQDRCGLLLDQLLPQWRRTRLRTKLADALAQSAGGVPETADALLSLVITVGSPPPITERTGFEWFATDIRLFTSDPITETSRAAFPQTFDAAAQLVVLAQLVAKLGLGAAQVPWLRGNWSNLDLKQLPTTRTDTVRHDLWTSLLALSQLLALSKDPNVGAARLANILLAAHGSAIDYTQVSGVLNGTEANLRALAAPNALNISGPAWLADLRQVAQLVACLDLCRKLRIPASLLVSAARAQTAPRPALEAESEAQALRQVALGGTPDGSWPEEEKTVLDQIRQRRRGASVDYLVQTRQMRDANDLYGYYLIDPQMGPCMMTTRIVQAISSVQLFIHRCFMSLEPEVPPASLNKKHWEWMKNFRVWEANRKVLLYPENWIEPELRDDKTPFFDDLVSALQQGDVASDKAQLAVQTFLERLTDFSRMEIVATCSSYDENNRLQVTHIFARTLSDPRTYFYRQFRNLNPTDNTNSLGVWTSWRALELDIEGDHLFAVVWQGRLFLFWAIFSKEASEPTQEKLAGMKDTPEPPAKFWRLKLAWSEYKSGVWSSRRLAQEDLMNVSIKATKPKPGSRVGITDSSDFFYFWTSVTEDGITINGVYDSYYAWYSPFTTLFFDGHKVIRAEGVYQAAGPGSGSGFRFIQSPAKRMEAPVDGSAPKPWLFLHQKMAIDSKSFGPLLSLMTMSGSYLHIFADQPRERRLTYSTRTTAAIFSAPSVFTALPIAPDSVAEPFLLTDRSHQFFVCPTRQLQTTLVPGSVLGINGPIPIWQISEAPKLHFYGLDWVQASRLRRTLAVSGIGALLSFDSQDSVRHPPVPYFDEYTVPPALVSGRPDGDIEFLPGAATSTYNFELFLHVPFAVACALSKNRRFEEARNWFHYIFDPTDTSNDPSPARYWRFRRFRELPGLPIEDLIQRLADPSDHSSEKLEFNTLIAQWKDDPFKPHLVARMRLRSYMYAVVMKYLDNLIDWADQLFRRDTMESLNEATQLYVLASQILGRRPESLPHRTRPEIKSYTELVAARPDDLTNALVEAENLIPGVPTGGASSSPPLQSLYFCVPHNSKLDAYYDRVEGQLYKLRNCMNIDGVVRELPLFAPEIDPGLLVRAVAAGLDIASALADLQAPLPLYRFSVMVQKANELCAEVKSLGAALLSAIEKTDGEALARLRSGHEMSLLKVVRLIKEAQLQEAKTNLDALGDQLVSAQTRFAHYVGLVSQVEPLSIPSGPVVGPTIQDLAGAALEVLSTATAFAQALTPTIDPFAAASFGTLRQLMARASEALAASLPPESMDTASVPMNTAEKHQLKELKSAHDLQTKAANQRILAQALAMIPDLTLGAQGFSSSPVVQFQIGGTLLSKVANFTASATDSKASEHSYRATLHSMLAGYQRRAADWLLQAQLASLDIAQIGEQIKAGTLRLAIATQELRNHDLQVANGLEADEFMRSKFSNQELFSWMSGQLSSLYFQAYQLAYDVAKRAERCFAHELGTDTAFIQFGYWDGLKKGLLAGEKLHADLKRMEVAYLNQNARELEITKHVSLQMLDPMALVRLQETGECEFSVPEVLFDLDFAGHYFRRIKSVSLSVPCVAGPYTSLSSTLTLLSSTVRVRSTPANQSYTDELNFRQSALPTQSIATSTGQNDSGMFELNFRDERYLPFEGAGAVGRWRLSMPKILRPFDYSTITDVILHIKYTARDGGGLLRTAAQDSVIDAVNAIGADNSGFNRLFSLRHEFPTEWNRFAKGSSANDPRSEEFALSLRRFPFVFAGKDNVLSITSLAIFAIPTKDATRPVSLPDTLQVFAPTSATALSATGETPIGLLRGRTFNTNNVEVAEKDENAKWKLTLPAAAVAQFQRDVDEVLIVCQYVVAKV